MRYLLALALLLCAIKSAPTEEIFARDRDHDYDAPAPGSYNLPIVKIAPDGALLDSDGHSSRLRDLTHGRVTVLSFIYTRCAAPNACPYATGVMSQLHHLSVDDQTLAKNMRLGSM